MNPEENLEELEELLGEVEEENKTSPIIVEGEKDIIALRKLGITGEILRLNTGLSIPDFCDTIAQKYKSCILLTDWDKKGGRLCSVIKKNLENRVICNVTFRGLFAKLTASRTVEGLPSWIETLRKKINVG